MQLKRLIKLRKFQKERTEAFAQASEILTSVLTYYL